MQKVDKHSGGCAQGIRGQIFSYECAFTLDLCLCMYFCIVSSPYLFVIGDDRVIHYTEAGDVAGGAGDAQSQIGASKGTSL